MRKALGFAALVAVGTLPATAQALPVSVNGTLVATGTYVANVFLDACNGLSAGGDALPLQLPLQLQWNVPANRSSGIFGDTDASCNLGDGGGGIETPIPQSGAGVGNVRLDLREVALAQLDAFDGGDAGPCDPPAALTFYVCVVEGTEDGTLSTDQAAKAWFLTVNVNPTLPPAPSETSNETSGGGCQTGGGTTEVAAASAILLGLLRARRSASRRR